ncbi:MAG: nucleotidyl transferase AbiEii/AbiGii toxin family protein [Holophagales bacterium]|nr:nucleotidyl transferase AbiEii/AbiGii toxin family protein [Holophagales bacterium]
MPRLAGLTAMPDLYLAGSAALALYLGHRQVRDLDWMGYNRLASVDRRDLLEEVLALDPGIRVETARDGFLSVRLPESAGSVGIRFYYYPYPLIDPECEVAGVMVASPVDLGLMKLGAIISRGGRRDFVDLFLLCREVPLRVLLERSPEKLGHVRDFPSRALGGLGDRHRLEGEPMPKLPAGTTWEEVEAWLDGDVRQLAREWLGLDRARPDESGSL